jgi:hypothetical protein
MQMNRLRWKAARAETLEVDVDGGQPGDAQRVRKKKLATGQRVKS